MNDENTTASDQPVPDAPEATGSGRYAVYDTTLLRYVGSVSDSKPTKAQANDLVHTEGAYRIDEV